MYFSSLTPTAPVILSTTTFAFAMLSMKILYGASAIIFASFFVGPRFEMFFIQNRKIYTLKIAQCTHSSDVVPRNLESIQNLYLCLIFPRTFWLVRL